MPSHVDSVLRNGAANVGACDNNDAEEPTPSLPKQRGSSGLGNYAAASSSRRRSRDLVDVEQQDDDDDDDDATADDKKEKGGRSKQTQQQRRGWMIWCLPFFSALIVFGNHYSRDLNGALQNEMQSDVPMSAFDFDSLNALYYAPNVITPLLMGVLQDIYTAPVVFLYTVCLSSVAQLFFGLGVQIRSLPLILLARGTLGLFYEAIDMGCIPITAPIFKEKWALVSGFTNGFLRLGSVFSFVLSPRLYASFGLSVPVWVSVAISLFALPLSFAMKTLASRYYSGEQTQKLSVKSSASLAAAAAAAAGGPETSLSIGQELLRRLRNAKSLPIQFWMYLLVGLFAYTALVPFYSVGSALLQRRYNLDTKDADFLMLLPEGTIAVASPILGLLVDYWGIRTRVFRMSVALICFVPVFAALSIIHHPDCPKVCMFLLGLFWSFFNAIFWGLCGEFCTNANQTGISIGFLGCSLNLGSSLLLLLIGVLQSGLSQVTADNAIVGLFSGFSALAAICSFILTNIVSHKESAASSNFAHSGSADNEVDVLLSGADSNRGQLLEFSNSRTYSTFESYD
mmetsp:Transcript_11929/g.21765  ORF Transcript_11929/g.21765 Transcript_11929/m.21765 type:complete len:569 (+) Transcript_11929:52-1758(+)